MEICIGKNIKYLRKKHNLDQQELADILNVPRSTLSCWENKIRTPKLEEIIKIAEYFQTNLDIIYTDLENNTVIEKSNDDLKKVLKEKKLMDNNGNLDIDKIDKVNKIYEAISEKED